MNLIVAVDENWGIGKDNRLLASIPADMKFFRETTTGHVVVMGRKTLESFPGKRPLKNRVNIVLTRDPFYEAEGAVIVHNAKELSDKLAGYDTDEVFVIGGESIYRQLLSSCDTAYVTKIEAAYDADAHFPDLDADPAWKLTGEGERFEHEGLGYRFCCYEKCDAEPEDTA